MISREIRVYSNQVISREIHVYSNHVSYWEREASQIPGSSNFCEAFCETLKGSFALVFVIIRYQCVLVFVSAFV